MSPSPRDWRLYADDIIDCCVKVGRFIKGMTYEAFVADERTRDAVMRNIEIIGEAAKNLPDEIIARARGGVEEDPGHAGRGRAWVLRPRPDGRLEPGQHEAGRVRDCRPEVGGPTVRFVTRRKPCPDHAQRPISSDPRRLASTHRIHRTTAPQRNRNNDARLPAHNRNAFRHQDGDRREGAATICRRPADGDRSHVRSRAPSGGCVKLRVTDLDRTDEAVNFSGRYADRVRNPDVRQLPLGAELVYG